MILILIMARTRFEDAAERIQLRLNGYLDGTPRLRGVIDD